MPKTKTPRKRSVTVTKVPGGPDTAGVKEGDKPRKFTTKKKADARKRQLVGDNSKDESVYGRAFTTKSSTSKESSKKLEAKARAARKAKTRAKSKARQIKKK